MVLSISDDKIPEHNNKPPLSKREWINSEKLIIIFEEIFAKIISNLYDLGKSSIDACLISISDRFENFIFSFA